MSSQSGHFKIKVSLLGLLLLAAILLSACASPTPTPVLPNRSTSTPAPTPVVVDVNLLYANPWTLVAYGNPDNPTVIGQGTTGFTQRMIDGNSSEIQST